MIVTYVMEFNAKDNHCSRRSMIKQMWWSSRTIGWIKPKGYFGLKRVPDWHYCSDCAECKASGGSVLTWDCMVEKWGKPLVVSWSLKEEEHHFLQRSQKHWNSWDCLKGGNVRPVIWLESEHFWCFSKWKAEQQNLVWEIGITHPQEGPVCHQKLKDTRCLSYWGRSLSLSSLVHPFYVVFKFIHTIFALIFWRSSRCK